MGECLALPRLEESVFSMENLGSKMESTIL